jgi:phenylpropionate dioxygenase-like ring-hydroxylating dioxygenase large terminal subunit
MLKIVPKDGFTQMQSIERPADIIAKAASNDAIVKNAWYIAAWSNEVSQELLARRIADEPMVLYRSSDGTAAALLDRCPHRKYPLSAGKLDGDVVQCGYHGFRFDTDGTCLSVPGQVKVPLSANVRSFPLVEQFGQIWVFPGDPALADAAKIPHVPWTGDWWTTTGHAPLNARAGLLIDNLLDLSHETYIHAGIGSPEVAETPIEVERDGDVLWVRRKMYGVACPPNYAKSSGLSSPIDRSQEIQFFAPSFYVLHVRVAAAGDTGPGILSKVVYGITPETKHTTHNFYGICRDLPRDPHKRPFSGQRNTVQEDTDALERLERALIADPDNVPEVSIGIDRGGLLGRRMIADLLRKEAQI